MIRFWNIIRFLGVLFAFCSPALTLRGQVADELKLKLRESVYLEEKTDTNLIRPWLIFPNIGLQYSYKDEKLEKAVEEAEKAKNMKALDTLLPQLISSFGPRNFTHDIDYIWRCGQVKEVLGDTTGAWIYYELGIKNQQPFIEKIKIHYDSLIARTHNEWVNLQFYYQILEARRKIDPLIPPKGVMLNMGPKVNSESPDYAPFMHPSDSVLVFTSRRDEEIVIDDIYAKMNEDLFFVEKDFINGSWSYAEKFSNQVNSQYNEGSACLSPDGRTLYFTRCDEPEGLGSCDIYVAEFMGGQWANIRNLGLLVNSGSWDSHPNITPDGKVLYFVSNRQGGFGKSDIYRTEKKEDGTWTKALNIGPMVNTIEDEVTPFFHQINNTLYFSSTGHLRNFGGYDIYKSRLLGPSQWEAPKNVGPLVNTLGNEYYFSIDGKGTRLFYARANDRDKAQINQNFDLYSFPMPMEARPDAIITLKGYLIDSASGFPITGIVLIIDKETGIEIAPKFINPYGYFEFDLINNKPYEIYIQGENFLTVKDEILVTGDTLFAVFAKSFQNGKPLVFESMQFDNNSWDLQETIEPQLNYILKFLERYPMFTVEVKGHTDSDGDAKYNLDLSRKRAAMIRKFIIKKGNLEKGRVSASGYGESRPLVPNDSEENKRQNRRVEFDIIIDPNYKGPPVFPTEEEFEFEEMEEFMDPEFMEEDEFEFDWDNEEELEEDEFKIEEEEDEKLLKEYDDWENWEDWEDEEEEEEIDGDEDEEEDLDLNPEKKEEGPGPDGAANTTPKL